MLRSRLAILILAVLTVPQLAFAQQPATAAESGTVALREQADVVLPLVESLLARDWLKAIGQLPTLPEMTLAYDDATHQAAVLGEGDDPPVGWQTVTLSDRYVYLPEVGSPMVFAAMLDAAASQGVTLQAGSRVLVLDCSGLAAPAALASLGVDVVAIDDDAILIAMAGKAQLPRLKVLPPAGLAKQLPFDLVLWAGALAKDHSLPAPAEQITQHLKPDGVAVLLEMHLPDARKLAWPDSPGIRVATDGDAGGALTPIMGALDRGSPAAMAGELGASWLILKRE